jgi:hypothetical protein
MSEAPSPIRRPHGPLRFARMAGSSVATPAAPGWVTDFLNAAYHARPEIQRDPAELRLAYGGLTTRWASLPWGSAAWFAVWGGREIGVSLPKRPLKTSARTKLRKPRAA